jgi:TatD DNase family protein
MRPFRPLRNATLFQLSRLMIETDAPFLLARTLPTKAKDGRNEPAYLPQILHTLVECLGKPAEEVAQATTRTARGFFRLNG